MQAFHNDPAIKEKYLARVRAHAAADEIIHGKYWEDGKGCAVGCTVHSGNHAAYETELGIPQWLARVEDRLFEGMTNGTSMTWPIRFLEAIPVGADLQPLLIPFLIIIVEKAKTRFDHKKYPKQLAAIDNVLSKLKAGASEKDLRDADADAAAADADAAAYAYAAADADADADAAAAAYAYAAAYAAAAAAYAAYADAYAAYADARSREYEYFAEELLKLLKAA